MSPITTHVLDLTIGRPAQGVLVVLSYRDDDGRWEEVSRAFTDADGRARALLSSSSPVRAGDYQIRFETGRYFSVRASPTFYPEVVVAFRVDDPEAHYHVPLLISPFGYSTYRGS
jgi:5-hydroxyisourate hydrolase